MLVRGGEYLKKIHLLIWAKASPYITLIIDIGHEGQQRVFLKPFRHEQTWERRQETREKPGDARRRERRKRRKEPRETRGVTRVARRREEPRADAMRREETRGDARDARRRERREGKREWLGLKLDFHEFHPFDPALVF